MNQGIWRILIYNSTSRHKTHGMTPRFLRSRLPKAWRKWLWSEKVHLYFDVSVQIMPQIYIYIYIYTLYITYILCVYRYIHVYIYIYIHVSNKKVSNEPPINQINNVMLWNTVSENNISHQLQCGPKAKVSRPHACCQLRLFPPQVFRSFTQDKSGTTMPKKSHQIRDFQREFVR